MKGSVETVLGLGICAELPWHGESELQPKLCRLSQKGYLPSQLFNLDASAYGKKAQLLS